MPRSLFPTQFSPETAGKIANFVAALKNMNRKVARTEIARSMKKPDGSYEDKDGQVFDPKQVYRRKRGVPGGYEEAVMKYLTEEFDELELYYILKNVFEQSVDIGLYIEHVCKNKALFETGKVLGSQQSMFDSLQVLRPRLEKGPQKFLLFTPTDDGALVLSMMEITQNKGELPRLPKFVTYEYNINPDAPTTVEGFMYEADGFLFAFGKMLVAGNLRVSKLKRIGRVSSNQSKKNTDHSAQMHDLIGLRLGGYSTRNFPNAHRLYGYEITSDDHYDLLLERVKAVRSRLEFNHNEMETHNEEIGRDFDIALPTVRMITAFLTRHESGHGFGNLDTPDPNILAQSMPPL